jgi:hypothetical protein
LIKRPPSIERFDATTEYRTGVEEGAAARERGKPISANPYRYDPLYRQSGAVDIAQRAGWNFGWRSAIWPEEDRQMTELEDDAKRILRETRTSTKK